MTTGLGEPKRLEYNRLVLSTFRSRTLLIVVGLLGGVGLGLGVAWWLARPRLLDLYPPPGATEVSARAKLRLTFSANVDPASVEEGLHLTPFLSGTVSWEGNTLIFTPRFPWPHSSVVTVTLSGARSRRGLPLQPASRQWTFTVSGARLAYLSGSIPNVWVANIAETVTTRQLTTEKFGVYDFDVSPDGAAVVYAALRADGGASLYHTGWDGPAEVLLACPLAACISPEYSPDGQQIAYEHHSLSADLGGDLALGDSQVHVYNLSTGQDQLVSEAERDARFPRWAPDGRLGYYEADRQIVVMRDLSTAVTTYIPNSSGEMGDWSPDMQYLIYPEIFLPLEIEAEPEVRPGELAAVTATVEVSPVTTVGRVTSRLQRVTLATNAVQDISGTGKGDDHSPLYSPDGEWVIFGRQALEDGTWTPGRQIWRMRPDGSEAHPLTADPLYSYTSVSWSPDGSRLVYMRSHALAPVENAEIWIMAADGSEARQIVSDAYLPRWLP